MDRCPMLPSTGNDSTAMVVAAALIVVVGVAMVLVARRQAMPILAFVLIVSGAIVVAGPAHAATDCPPSGTAATPVPTSSSPSPSTTTTLAGLAPDAIDDDLGQVSNEPISYNVLLNDML